MNWLNKQRIRLLSHITWGETKKHYKKKYQKVKPPKATKHNVNADNTCQLNNAFKTDIYNYINFANTQLMEHIRLYQQAQALHPQVFAKYKNIYRGKDVYLIATGPTLNYFDGHRKGIYVGVNKSFQFDKITLDYLFMQDWLAVKPYINESLDYKNPNLKRFYGIMQYGVVPGWIIPESVAIRHKAKRYYSRVRWPDKGRSVLIKGEEFAYDICAEPLTCSGSVVFPAMQYILYTNPKRIYLVGCDCKNTGYFDSTQQNLGDPNMKAILYGWKLMKQFIDTYYPETEIISVNPVGLKGMFHDVYTETYLNAHPEISCNEEEILK